MTDNGIAFKRVVFIDFDALVEGELKDCTDYKIKRHTIEVLRRNFDLCKVVVLHNNKTDIPYEEYIAMVRSVSMFLTTYLGVAVDFRFAGFNDSPDRYLPNIWLLDEAAMGFPALLGGKSDWVYIGTELDKEAAENFEVSFVDCKKI